MKKISKKESKEIEKFNILKENFSKQYEHIFHTKIEGGIIEVDTGIMFFDVRVGLRVTVKGNKEVYDQLPLEFEGYVVHKKMEGELRKLHD